MTTTTLQFQRTATPFANLLASLSPTMQSMFAANGDRREQYLAQSVDHADFAARERAFDEHEARSRSLFDVL